MFKFTFNFGTHAAFNPFTAQAEERERVRRAVAPQTIKRKLPAPPRRPSPPLSITEDAPCSRKRGWTPTSSSASEAKSQPTVTNGWIDTPAKYLKQASLSRGDDEDADVDLPPTKKRKTLTDSIISTAFSAALIGTAVGMTAYRLWRDRGKSSEEPTPVHMDAPPPYERQEWVDDTPRPQSAAHSPRFNKKSRPAARRVPRHRRAPIVTSPARSPAHVLPPSSSGPVEPRHDLGELENQIDSLDDKIRRLIKQGQKALGNEIVIQADDQNDDEGAIDDGMDGWEEENQAVDSSSATYASRQRSSKSLAFNPFTYPPTPHGGAFPAYRVRENQLAGRAPKDDFEVIYEPGNLVSEVDLDDSVFEDEDSRRLTQGIDAVRKAYHIH